MNISKINTGTLDNREYILMKNRREELITIPKFYITSYTPKLDDVSEMVLEIPNFIEHQGQQIKYPLYDYVQAKRHIVIKKDDQALERFVIESIETSNEKGKKKKKVVARSYENILKNKTCLINEGVTRQLYKPEDETFDVEDGILNMFEQQTGWTVAHIDEQARKEVVESNISVTMDVASENTYEKVEKDTVLLDVDVNVPAEDGFALNFDLSWKDLVITTTDDTSFEAGSIVHTFVDLPCGVTHLKATFTSNAEQRYGMTYELTLTDETVKKVTYAFVNCRNMKLVSKGNSLTYITSQIEEKTVTKYRFLEHSSGFWYQYLKTTIQEAFNCYIFFDSYNKTISVYDKPSKQEWKGFHLDFDNLLTKVTKTQKISDLCTRLWIQSNNVDITEVNPLGTSYIEDYSYFIESGTMSNELKSALERYYVQIELLQEQWLELKKQKDIASQWLTKRNSELVSINEQVKAKNALLTAYIKAGDNEEGQKRVAQELTELENQASAKLAEVDELKEQNDKLATEMQLIGKLMSKEMCEDSQGKIFTTEDLEELTDITIEQTYNDDYHTKAPSLFKYVKELMKDKARLTYDFTLEHKDFVKGIKHPKGWDWFVEVGGRVEIEDKDIADSDGLVTIYSFTYSPKDEKITSVDFSNNSAVIQAVNGLASIGKLVHNTANMTDYWKHTWVEADKATAIVSDIRKNGLDLAANIVRGGSTVNKISMSEAGLFIIDAENENNQIYLGASLMAMTDDKWITSKTAVTTGGVLADSIVGRLILGEKLFISNEDGSFEILPNGLTIRDELGKEQVSLGIDDKKNPFLHLGIKDESKNHLIFNADGTLDIKASSIKLMTGDVVSKEEMEEIANNVANKLDLAIRNYALDTVMHKTLTGNGNNEQVISLYELSQDGTTFMDEEVTLTFKYTTTLESQGSFFVRTGSNHYQALTDVIVIGSETQQGKVAKTVTITKEVGQSFSDLELVARNFTGEITISMLKFSLGNKATDWTPAPEDSDASYSVILTNESQVIPTTTSLKPLSNSQYTTQVIVYQGTKQQTNFKIKPLVAKDGITPSINGDTITFSVNKNTILSTNQGQFEIEIEIDNMKFKKMWAWAIASQGQDGTIGESAKQVVVTGEQVFKYQNNFTGNPSNLSIRLTATLFNTTGCQWSYRVGSGNPVNINGATNTTLDVQHNGSYWGNHKQLVFRCTSNDGVFDEITIVKVSDGINGEGSYSAFLTNENHSFPCESNGNIPVALETTTNVVVFKGSEKVTPRIGDILKPDGLDVRVEQPVDNEVPIVITALAGNRLGEGGNLAIPIIVGSEEFEKSFTYSKAKSGEKGEDGSNAHYITITGEQFFKYDKSDFSGTPTPSQITLTAQRMNLTGRGEWQYLDGAIWRNLNVNTDTLTVTPTTGGLAHKSTCSFRFIVDGNYDIMTVAKLSNGANGQDGINGSNAYFYIRYSANADGSNMTSTPQLDTEYMGTCSSTSAIAPTNPSAYTWVLIKGEDGEQGIKGEDGANGESSYLHVKYSNDGRTFTPNNGEDLGSWIGTYVDNNPMDSSVFSDYNWSKFVGENGESAKFVIMSGEQAFKYENDFTGDPLPTSIKLSTTVYNINNPTYQWSFKRAGETTWNTINGATSGNYSLTHNNPTIFNSDDVKSVTLRCTVNNDIFDEMTVVKVSDGANSESYTVILTNETHLFPCDGSGSVTTPVSITTTAIAYRGSHNVIPTIGELPIVKGLTLSKEGATVTVQANVGADLADNGTFDIPVIIEDKTFVKVFSWSKAKAGADGVNGYTILLDNENFTFQASSTGNITSQIQTTTTATVYQGTTQKTPMIGNLPSVSGLTLSKNGATVTIVAKTGTALAEQGEIPIPIIVDNQTFTRKFTWTKARSGAEAQYVVVNGEQVFKYTDNFSGTPTPSQITLTADKINISTNGKWQYKNANGSWTDWTVNNTVVTATTLTVSPNSHLLNSAKQMSVRYIVGTLYDEVTIVKVSDGINGSIGIGIKTIQEQYYLSTSQTSLMGGSWQTTAPKWETGKFIWTKTVFTYTNDMVEETTPICVTGRDGADGMNGGVSVSNVDVFYYQSNSATSLVGGSWSTEAPTWVNGKYIWSKTITYLDNGKTIESDAICITGQKGQDGSEGKGIKTITNYYLASSSSTGITTSTSGWTTEVQTMTSTKKYLWNYEKVTYTDDSITNTTPAIIGVFGTDGVNGQDGVGIKSIREYYLATNSASGVTSATSGWTETVQTPTKDKKYLWNYEVIVYTNNTTYTGTPRIIGNFAQDGMNGSNGTNGADAYTVILSNENHTFPCESNGNIPTAINATTNIIAYKGATSVTPTIGNLPSVNGLTLSKSGTTVTIQANTGTALTSSGSLTIPVTVDGKNFNKVFSWSKAFKGANGASGSHAKSADIVSTSQVFKSTDGGATFTPDNITLTPILQNVSFSKWQYSTNGGSSWTNVSSGQNGLTVSGNNLVIDKGSNLYTTSVTSVTFKLITNDSNIYDTMTIVKLYDVTDLEIGGANVLRNGNFARGMEHWSIHNPSNTGGSNKSVAVIDGDGTWSPIGKKVLQIKGTMTTDRYGVISSTMKLDPKTQYTISGYCAGQRVEKIQINVRDMNSSSANIFTKDLTPVTGGATLDKWHRFELTFKTTSNTDFALNLYSVNFDDNGFVWFNEVQIQKGNKATDWTPCPTDGTDYTDKLIDDLRKLDLKQITDQNQESSDMIANILNDSLIMPHEKTSLKFEFERIKILKENAINYYNTVNDTSFQQLRNAMNTAYTNVENMINPILANMTQTSNASNSAVHTTFQTFYTAYETLMTALQQSVIILATKHSTKLEQLDKEITMTASKTEIMQDKVNQFDAHMRFSADGFVEIFATENGKKGRFSTQITNKKLSFKDNDVEVAYVSNQELNINKAVINDTMKIGNFAIKPSGSSTGGIVFAYETGGANTDSEVRVTGISIDISSATLEVGATKQVNANVVPTNASNKNIIWSSSSTGVASVSASGLITAKSGGSCTITAKTSDGGFTKTISVTVKQIQTEAPNPTPPSPTIPVTGIEVDEWDVTLKVGGSKQLNAYVVPRDATNQLIHWYSNNTSVATVTSSGLVQAVGEGYALVTATTDEGGIPYNVHVNVEANSSGGTTPNPPMEDSTIANGSETPIYQQYSTSHEAKPNNPNPASGAYNWNDAPRINPDGAFPQSSWNAIGHWMTSYLVKGASYYDNVAVLLQNPKMWIWNTSTRSWDVLSDDFEWGTWYLEDFWNDGNGNIGNTTLWQTGESANHSKWVKIKQTSETTGRCFHPWGYQKNWRNNSNWSNNGQPYIITKVDFKLVKWDSNGVDNLDRARIVVDSGADWWRNVGDTWQSDWSTSRDMAVGKYILATRDLKRAYCTNLPQNWSYGFPTVNDNPNIGEDAPSGGGSTVITEIQVENTTVQKGQKLAITFSSVGSVTSGGGCCLFDSNNTPICTGYFESNSKAVLDTETLGASSYSVFLSASQWDENIWNNKPISPRSNVFTLSVTESSGGNNTPPSGGTPSLSPSSATLNRNQSQTFTIIGATSTIAGRELANSRCSIDGETDNTITITGRVLGSDVLIVTLSDGTQLQAQITIN